MPSPHSFTFLVLASGLAAQTQVALNHFFVGLETSATQAPTIVEFDATGSLVATWPMSAQLPPGIGQNGWGYAAPCEVTPSGTLLCTTFYHPNGGWFECDGGGAITRFYADAGGSIGQHFGARQATVSGNVLVGAHMGGSFGGGQLRYFDVSTGSLIATSDPCNEAMAAAASGGTVYVGLEQVDSVHRFSMSGAAQGGFGSYRNVYVTKALPGQRLLIGHNPVDAAPTVWIVRDLVTGAESTLPATSFPGFNTYADVDDGGQVWVLAGTTAVCFDSSSQTIVGTIALPIPGTPVGFAVSGAPGIPLVTATASSYGSGCGTPPLTFVPDALATPRLGQVASATVINSPTPFVGAAMGFSNTFVFPIVLPFELSGIGMPGCYLNQSNELFGMSTTVVSPTSARFDYSIPWLPAIAGAQVYIQAYALAPGVNPLQVIVSNGIAWRLGHL